MALTLSIGATSFITQYVTNSARIHERIQNQSNTLNLEIVKRSGAGHNTPEEGREIVFKDGSRFLFAGYITRVDPIETGEGQLFRYRIEATDYTYILLNKNAQKTYNNQTLSAIVADLLSEYVDSGYALTDNNVATGPTISTIAFNHISLRKAFEKLAQVTGYVWWIDYEKDIHFIDAADATVNPAPEDITDSSDNFSDVSIKCDVTQVRNSIVVRGGREETTTDLVQIIEADGVASEWLLREKPKSMTSIEVNTGGGYVAQTVGVDPIDEDTGNDFMFNFQEKFIRQAEGESLLSAGDLIRVTYKYEVPVIVKLKDTASILAMAAIEGGDGLHEHTIVNPSINSKDEARKVALQELAEYANPIVSGTFETHTGILGKATLVNEDMQSAPSGTLKNSATYDGTNKWVRLTQAVNSQQGQLEYENMPTTTDFDCTFEFWTGGGNGADAVALYIFADATPSDEDLSGATTGLSFAYDEFNSNTIQVNDPSGTITSVSAGVDLDDSTWRTARIVKQGNKYTVYLNGTPMIEYVDTEERDVSGSKWGFVARTGGFNNEHRVRKIVMKMGNTVFQPGQLLTVNLPTWGISTDTEYVIQEVGITLVEDGSNIEYNYSITFGGRLLGVSEFLESLAGEEHVILATEEIERIEAVQETATISETVTLEPNTEDVSETATVSEDITRTNFTPPFQYGPGGSPQGVWNSSEWG